MNLMVRGAHDEGIYCVDVGIVRTGVVPQAVEPEAKWECVPNESLISFAEVKRLLVYPMLLPSLSELCTKLNQNSCIHPSLAVLDGLRTYRPP